MPQSLWTAPVEQITFEDVRYFCSLQHKEGVRLDYKQALSETEPPGKNAKVVCAMANRDGGLIIIGVKEDPPKSRLPEKNPQGQEIGNDANTRVGQACNTISPPVYPEISPFIPNPNDPRIGFVVVRLDRSPDLPHCIGDHYYVRDHDRSEPRPATREELQILFDRSRDAEEIQRQRAKRNVARLRRALRTPAVIRGGAPVDSSAYISASIGPTQTREPILDLMRFRCGIDPIQRQLDSFQERAADSNLFVANDQLCGCACDQWGNIAIMRHGAWLQQNVRFEYLEAPEWWLQLLRPLNYQIPAVFVGRALSPIIHAVRRYQQACVELDLYGRTRMCVEIRKLLHMSLVATGPRMIGGSRAGDSAEFGLDFPQIITEDDVRSACVGAARKMLWAWNCWTDPSSWNSIVDDAYKMIDNGAC